MNAFWLEFVELVYRHFVSLEKNESFRSPNGEGTDYHFYVAYPSHTKVKPWLERLYILSQLF